MLWNCDGGTPKIFIAGGGGSGHNINLGIISPPSTAATPLNLTGQPTGHQDMADMVVDPKTNDMYMIFAQGFVTPITENNKMYKSAAPYNSTTTQWSRMSGYTSLNERNNRPYLGLGSENSVNTLAVNSGYLFYYDGLNLKALNKATGADQGTAITLPSTLLMQGGIVADECNNVYVGSINGTIKVYKFNGSTFDDGAAADISIAGYPTASVYDLAFDNGKHVLYACGNGFVAAIDITANCAVGIYTVTVRTACNSLSATATLSPAVPAGSTVTYVLYDGSTVVTSNSTGIFNRLTRTGRYTVQARIDEACGGTHASADFDLSRCTSGPGVPGIYVPTAFTPNGDGLNDILKAVPFDVELKKFTIYNRWGEIVFMTTDPDKGWDGTLKGQKQQTGVFVWQAEGLDFDNVPVSVKGTTTLIR
jgi:gliding motility-associated-like protein